MHRTCGVACVHMAQSNQMSRGAFSSIFSTVIDPFVLLTVFRASSGSISESLEDSTPLPFAMPQGPDFQSNRPGWIFSPTATGGCSTCTNKKKHTSITANLFFVPSPGLHSPLASTTAVKRERIPMAQLADIRPKIRSHTTLMMASSTHGS